VLTAQRHLPVMVDRAVELLRPRQGGVYLDATLGLGGHSERILEVSAPSGRVIGLDRDPAALALARERLAWAGERLVTVAASFADLTEVAAGLGVERVDGVLYDLGVSSLQLDEPERGFSYRVDAPLDMRMDTTGGITAAEVLATYPRAELTRVFRRYGEERFASRIARFVDDARRRAPITTTGELVDLVKAAIPAAARRGGPHPARRVFQALRIEVNDELSALSESLPQAIDLLAPGGRLVVLSYHSLEDRITKRTFLAAASGREDAPPHLAPALPAPGPAPVAPRIVILTRRPETPGPDEVAANPRAESAKLRAAEKLPPSDPAGGNHEHGRWTRVPTAPQSGSPSRSTTATAPGREGPAGPETAVHRPCRADRGGGRAGIALPQRQRQPAGLRHRQARAVQPRRREPLRQPPGGHRPAQGARPHRPAGRQATPGPGRPAGGERLARLEAWPDNLPGGGDFPRRPRGRIHRRPHLGFRGLRVP
jgi:16S rRNA (cytosine1402-N4)-methyltransferase